MCSIPGRGNQVPAVGWHHNDPKTKQKTNVQTEVNVTRPRWWLVNIGSGNGLVSSGNIGSGNGLVPLGTKPIPEPMLTKIYVDIWRR